MSFSTFVCTRERLLTQNDTMNVFPHQHDSNRIFTDHLVISFYRRITDYLAYHPFRHCLLVLPFLCCVSLGKLLNLSESQLRTLLDADDYLPLPNRTVVEIRQELAWSHLAHASCPCTCLARCLEPVRHLCVHQEKKILCVPLSVHSWLLS